MLWRVFLLRAFRSLMMVKAASFRWPGGLVATSQSRSPSQMGIRPQLLRLLFRNIPMGADQITLREHLESAFVDQVGEPMLYEWVLSIQELLEAEFEAEPIS
mmetsp:Transcript_69661/g.160089  ORF Transcript_69661/g.160089 Transcript_69661/m.160089 type:complete len:102 (+) Transcript_69661:1658-1963(+)